MHHIQSLYTEYCDNCTSDLRQRELTPALYFQVEIFRKEKEVDIDRKVGNC